MLKNARTLQFAWFTTGAETASPLRLFDQMFGREPDAFQKLQPPQVPFPITAQVFVDEGVEHKLQTYAGRIDYIISSTQLTPELPMLPWAPESHLNNALEVARRGAKFIGNINRAAVILTLSEKIESLPRGAEFFTKLFGGLVKFENQSDLQFQMNSRIKGTPAKSDINRLTKWTCDTVQFQQVLNLPGAPGPTPAGELVDLVYLNYMIDINNVPSSEVYQPAEHDDIFTKLASSALDLTRIANIQDVSNVC